MLRSMDTPSNRNSSEKYVVRLSPEQESTLEAQFARAKTLHSTDLALLAAEMGLQERQVQAWYVQRIASWRRDQGLSDCFGTL